MYCPNCGNTVNKKLKFCNSCGQRLAPDVEVDRDGTPGKMLDNVLTTLFLVVMFGLGILVGLVAVLLGNDVRPEPVVVIVIVYLAAIFGICFALARQASRIMEYRLKSWNSASDHVSPAQLEPPITAQLEEFRQPVGSVTDSTTKTLHKVPVARN
jgi:hypothetical protein